MANAGHSPIETSADDTLMRQKRLYKSLMDFTMLVGLPVGGAVAMLVATLLMQAGLFVSFFAAFLTMVGLWLFAKTFLVH
ncbi:MAG: hypothetical protein ACWA5T_10400 [Parvularcula sp.]